MRYGSAVLLIAIIGLVCWLLVDMFEEHAPFGAFLVGIVIIAWYFGFGPALLATILGALGAAYVFITPLHSLGISATADKIGLLLYLTGGTAIAWIGRAVAHNRQRLELLLYEAGKRQIQLEQQIAERLQAEQAVRLAKEQLHLIIDSVPVLLCYIDDQGVYRLVNRAYCVWSKIAPAEMLGKHMREAVDESLWSAIRPHIEKALAGTPVSYEDMLLHDGSGVCHIQGMCVPHQDQDGRTLGVIGLVQDITERKRTELHNALLAELGERIQAGQAGQAGPLDRSTDEILRNVTTLVGSRLGVSRALFGEVDIERGELRSYYQYVDGVAELTRLYPLAEFGPVVAESRLGKCVWCSDVRTDARTAPYQDIFLADQVMAFLVIPLVRDGVWVAILTLHSSTPRDWAPDEIELVRIVAERTWLAMENQRLSMDTRRSEEQLRLMAETVPDILFMCRPDGQPEYVTARFYEHTGMTPEEVMARGWQSVVHPEDLPRASEQWHASHDLGQPFEAELRLRSVTGTYRWHIARCQAMRDSAGRVVRWFGAATDIDDRKRVEEKLREADQRKDEFLATLAHELRNPLAPIRNAASILRLTGRTDKTIVWARDVIDRQVAQMTRLVDDLLDVARISRGKIELHKQWVELSAVVQSALETSQPLIVDSGHTLEVSLPAQPILIEVDATRMAQVLANLLNNAAKYTDRGGHIWLSADLQGARVAIRVRDTGIGISAEMLPRVFDMFTQANMARGRAQGVGIGLTLVRRLVEMHGGTVEARSPGLGQGSEFTVLLPIIVAEADAQEGVTDAGASVAGGRASPMSAHRVLVVDDNEDSADSLAMLLERRGYEVRVAYSGRSALRVAKEIIPDTVLLDIGLPDISGYEVARQIRNEPRLRHAMLIAQTGWGQDEDRRRSQEAGFDHHLVKPIEPQSLHTLLGSRQAPKKQ